MRVMITTVTAGGGHLAAAAALEEAWKSFRPTDVLDKVDLVKFFSPIHRKIYSGGYVELVNRAPELWGYMFGKTDHPEVARRWSRLRRLFPGHSRLLFARHTEQFKPDLVFCTHYLPLDTLDRLKGRAGVPPAPKSRAAASPASNRRANSKSFEAGAPPKEDGQNLRPTVVTIVTDYEAHALWMHSCTDLYCVATEQTKARLVARGAEADKIIVTGIPISAKFSAKIEPGEVRKSMGFRDDQPILLVPSGGFGMGPVGKILDELDKIEKPFQTVVVTGRNAELRRELAGADRRHPTHILGFTSNMHELMSVSDLIITKPGGLTTAEALAMGKPLLVINPIPGQEAANSDFLLENGAAAKVNRVEDIPFRLSNLLGSPKLEQMARAAAALGRPQAATHICEAALRIYDVTNKS